MPPASTRPAGMSDVEWQIKNWYNFLWLCGDSIVEQAVHSADKIAWAHERSACPSAASASAVGKFRPKAATSYDHFEVNYLYPNNVRAFLGCRQIDNCWNENADYILGTKGACTIGRGPDAEDHRRRRNGPSTGQKNDMYQYEHDVLFASIRQNKPINDGERMATSTLLAMMGRMAAYTGQRESPGSRR